MAVPQIAQIAEEFSEFVDLLGREGVRSYLEVGSQYGGSLWQAANALPVGCRIVSVDLPTKRKKSNETTQSALEQTCEELRHIGYDVHLFLGDSTNPEIIDAVRNLGPFDAIFIDANHTLPYVTADWNNYGPMGKIVAFHDIAWDRPVGAGRLPIEVAKLWRDIKQDYINEEIVEGNSEKGIGVIWRS